MARKKLGDSLFDLMADLGDWLTNNAKEKTNAIILGIVSVFSPLGFLFSVGFIVKARRDAGKRKTK